VRVVDDHAERPDGGQVRTQPVEAVEDRERSVNAPRGRNVCGRCARKAEEAGRDAGGAVQEIGPLELRRLDQRGLEELSRHSKGEITLQLGSPRTKHTHPAFDRRRSRRREQRRLPDPGRPFKHEERAAP